jgi:hypothetical protein
MTFQGVPLTVGAFTPALRSLALHVMEQLLLRPAARAILDQSGTPAGPFQVVLDHLARKKYTDLIEWKEAVVEILNVARAPGDEMMEFVCEELDRWFSKRYNTLQRLSEFKFQDALKEVIAKLKQIRDIYASEMSE